MNTPYDKKDISGATDVILRKRRQEACGPQHSPEQHKGSTYIANS